MDKTTMKVVLEMQAGFPDSRGSELMTERFWKAQASSIEGINDKRPIVDTNAKVHECIVDVDAGIIERSSTSWCA